MIKKVSFIIIGIGSIILSIVMFNMDTGHYVSREQYGYGWDAYSAQAANNTRDLAEITKFGFGSVLLITGIKLFAIGLSSKSVSNDSNDATNNNQHIRQSIKLNEIKNATPTNEPIKFQNKELLNSNDNYHQKEVKDPIQNIPQQNLSDVKVPIQNVPQQNPSNVVVSPNCNTKNLPSNKNNVSVLCVCGTRCYEKVCPNCGRELKR